MYTKNTTSITLVLGVITLAALLANLYLFNSSPRILIEKSNLQLIPAIGYVVAFIFHIVSLVYLLSSYKLSAKFRRIKIVAIIIFVFSLISFLVDKVMIDEIADEINYGWKLSLILLNIPIIFKWLYTCFVLLIIFFSMKVEEKGKVVEKRDETIFSLAQIIGILTGALGILQVVGQIIRQSDSIIFSLPAYLILLVPYLIVVVYWLMLKYKERIIDVYDEKQWRDLTRSALITMLISIPAMAILLFINKPLGYLWFPYYLFMVLFLFSGSTLYLYKRD